MFPFSLDGLREKKKHFLLFFLVLEREIERGARPVNATEALDIIKWEKRKRERGLGHDQKSSLLSRSSFARSTAMNLHKVSPPPFFKILNFFLETPLFGKVWAGGHVSAHHSIDIIRGGFGARHRKKKSRHVPQFPR